MAREGWTRAVEPGMMALAEEARESVERGAIVGNAHDRTGDGMAVPGPRQRQCERCGGEARVHVLEGYLGGRSIRRHFCFACTDAAYYLYLDGGAGHAPSRSSWGSLLITAGLFLAVVGAMVGLLGVQSNAGFGWKQQAGLSIGALVVIVGALLRAPVLAVVGTVFCAVAALADVLGSIGPAGPNGLSQAVILAGLLLVLVGLFLRDHRSRRGTPGTD